MDAQTWVVLGLVAAAALYLLRRLWRNAKGDPAGACDKCAAPAAEEKHKP